MRARPSWRRLVIEGVLIVASILLAFAIDAWWDGVVERRALLDSLEGIRDDFVENAASLDSARIAHERIKQNSQRLLQFTGPQGLGNANPATIDTLVIRVLDRHRFDPIQASLLSLLSSGRFELIRNQTLQNELARWPVLVDRLSYREAEAVEGINNRLIVRIWELVPIRSLDVVEAEFKAEVGLSRFPVDYDALLRDMYFESAVDERWQDARASLVWIARLAASADQIIALIDQEIGSEKRTQ